MSVILDALKRAERERRIGQAPTLETLAHAPPPRRPPSRPQARWLAAATLLVAVLAIGIALWRQPAPVAPVPAIPAPPSAAPAAIAVPAPAQGSQAIAEPDAIASFDDLVSAGEAPEPAADDADAPSAPAPAPNDNAAGTAIAAAEASADATADATLASPPEAMAIALRDLPADLRAQFPPLRLDVHVHDEDPARRWIMVGGQRYREHEALPGGLRLEQIVADGVIVDYRGQRVTVPVR